MTSHFIRDENIVTGIYIQDPQMKSGFSRFPEVLLVDATHKTNDRVMVLYKLLCIDGNGESQVAATFLIQHETEVLVHSMVQKFKEKKRWEGVQTVMTDKNINKCDVFESEMPQICLEIYLFHVLRSQNLWHWNHC